jgi:hypothetical protein
MSVVSILRSMSPAGVPVLAVALLELAQPAAVALAVGEAERPQASESRDGSLRRGGRANGAKAVRDTTRDGIWLSDGHVSIRVFDRSLISILDQLSAMQDGVAMRVEAGVTDRRVTIELDTVPLDSALRALLDDEDVLLLYGARGSALKAVVVYPKGLGARDVCLDARRGLDGDERLLASLGSSDEKERAAALRSLIERRGTGSQELVLRALEDESSFVREQALHGALDSGLALPEETLVRLATTDPAASVRMHATEALADRLGGPDALERAMAIAASP